MSLLGLVLLVVWSISFPFIHAFGLSRAFGIRQQIDRSILLALQISLSGMAVFNGFLIDWFFSGGTLSASFITVPAIFVNRVVVEGLIWQVYLKDRKMNGFLISLICTAAYLIPNVIFMNMMFN